MTRWYVLQVKTGTENDVKMALLDKGYQVMLPKAIRRIRSEGAVKETENILIPGYVMVLAEYNAENYYRAKGIPGVIKWLGDGAPSYMSHQEVEWMKLLSRQEIIEPSLVEKDGDGYRILEGILKRIPTDKIKINAREKKAIIKLSVCGEEKEVTVGVEVKEAKAKETDTEEMKDKS